MTNTKDISYYGLSTPKQFTNKDLMIDIKEEYNILNDSFINQDIRPVLKGIPIFIKNEKISGMEERFLHCISIEDKGYYNRILPCSNLPYASTCIPKCKINCASFLFKRLNRIECQYRLSRIQWIPQIIEYANNNDKRVKMWRYDKKDNSGKWYWNRYVRYKSVPVDFLIVFEEMYDKEDKTKLNYLKLVTAYPIFKPVEADDLDKQSQKYPL